MVMVTELDGDPDHEVFFRPYQKKAGRGEQHVAALAVFNAPCLFRNALHVSVGRDEAPGGAVWWHSTCAGRHLQSRKVSFSFFSAGCENEQWVPGELNSLQLIRLKSIKTLPEFLFNLTLFSFLFASL